MSDNNDKLIKAAEELFSITDAIKQKLVLQYNNKKDYGLGEMLDVCLKHAGMTPIKPSPNLEVHEGNISDIENNNEDNKKIELEKEAREDGIELDRRMTLANMQEDYNNKLEDQEEYEEED